jgi:glutamate synthase domain-containing protein 3
MNADSLVTCPVTVPHWDEQLRTLVERHAAETGSRRAAELLADWATARAQFLQVCPREMLPHLAHPLAVEG